MIMEKPLKICFETQNEDEEIQAMDIIWQCIQNKFLINDSPKNIKTAKRVIQWVNKRIEDIDTS